MDPDDTSTPCRGGNDYLGIFLGGAALTDTYTLTAGEEPYQCALQLRNNKSLLAIESDLRKMNADTSTARFNGTLTLTEDSPSTELDKEEFLLAVDNAVTSYGFHTFFYIPDASGKMQYLPEASHLFTVESVLQEHEERMVEPSKVLDSNGDEVVSSICARFRAYDKYERFDISLSQ